MTFLLCLQQLGVRLKRWGMWLGLFISVSQASWDSWMLSVSQFGSLVLRALAKKKAISKDTVFVQSNAMATNYFTARFLRLLFEGGFYFLKKPADIDNCWIGHVQAIQWWLLNAVSSTRSLWVQLSAVGINESYNTNCPGSTWEPPRLLFEGRIYFTQSFRFDCVHMATIQGQRLFEGGVYSKKYGIPPRPIYNIFAVCANL